MHRKNAAGRSEEQPANVVKASPERGRIERTGSVAKAVVEHGPPQLGEQHRFWCAVCEHEADATYKRDRVGLPQWFVGSHVDRCLGGGACLGALAKWLDAPSGSDIKADPRPYLHAVASVDLARSDAAARLPSGGSIDGWHSRLVATAEPFRYVTDARGLTVDTIRRYRLGWDGDALTLAVHHHGSLANLLRRGLQPGDKFKGLLGRGSQLFPEPGPRGVLLLAGIFDVLSARQAGAHYAVTTTCGAKLPDHLAPELAGRRVAVAYDVGEEPKAERTVAKLRALGSEAWLVRLGLLGLPAKGDLNDYYRAGGSTCELVELCRRERGRA